MYANLQSHIEVPFCLFAHLSFYPHVSKSISHLSSGQHTSTTQYGNTFPYLLNHVFIYWSLALVFTNALIHSFVYLSICIVNFIYRMVFVLPS